MSTLRTNIIENNGSPVNFTTDIAIGAGKAIREYYAQADEPSGAGNGAVWWDTTNSVYKLRIAGKWYTVEQAITPSLPFLGDRGIFGGGFNATFNNQNTIDYITITTPGNAIDFGDLTVARQNIAACSNGSRGLFGGGYVSNVSNVIDYVTIATTGNAIDFGDLTVARSGITSCSNDVRGLFSGGNSSASVFALVNAIDYVTIATTSNAIDFGDLTGTREGMASCSDGSRGLFGGGTATGGTPYLNVIEYVTIATQGNAIDFGDLTDLILSPAACSNSTYGLFGGGRVSAGAINVIAYVTIATTGNAIDFGDLTVAREGLASCSNGTIGIFGGGGDSTRLNTIDYVTIATPGNAIDFGDLTVARQGLSACSGN